MAPPVLTASGISKTFNRRNIFSGINFSLELGGSIAITGRNGSGKSTLLKITAGVLAPTAGTVQVRHEGKTLHPADAFNLIGFVSPYLQMYDEFTAWENLDIFRRIRGISSDDSRLLNLLTRVNLQTRKDDPVRTYSSGMKQRLKYAFALVHDPLVLLVDEPASNLDAEGIDIIYGLIEERRKDGITVLATNDSRELRLCASVIDLDRRDGGGAA